jgi:hypothetical protein
MKIAIWSTPDASAISHAAGTATANESVHHAKAGVANRHPGQDLPHHHRDSKPAHARNHRADQTASDNQREDPKAHAAPPSDLF